MRYDFTSILDRHGKDCDGIGRSRKAGLPVCGIVEKRLRYIHPASNGLGHTTRGSRRRETTDMGTVQFHCNRIFYKTTALDEFPATLPAPSPGRRCRLYGRTGIAGFT